MIAHRATRPVPENYRPASRIIAAGLFGLLAATGCGELILGQGGPNDRPIKPPPPIPPGDRRTQVVEPEISTFAYRYPDQPPVLDAAGLNDLVARFQHDVILLDFWSAATPRCREEMPTLVRLQQELDDSRFQVVSANLDRPDDWSRRTVPILHGLRAGYPCVVVEERALPDVRAWIAAPWDFNTPARVLLDRHGRIADVMLADTPIQEVETRARQLVLADDPRTIGGALSATAAALQTRLINVRTGEWESLEDVMADPADPRQLARLLVAQVRDKIDRSNNPRIAILPFPSVTSRTRAGPLGQATATAVEAELRRAGFFDLIPPDRTERQIRSIDLSTIAIDFDPARVKGRLNGDYLLIGWLKGNVEDHAEVAGANIDDAP